MRSRQSPVSRSWSRLLAAAAVVMAVVTCAPADPGNYGREDAMSRAPAVPQWFGGYLDVTLTPNLRLQDLPAQGTVTAVLSFIGAHPTQPCQPSWDGYYTLDQAGATLDLEGQLKTFRAAGNDIAIAFGGQLATELAVACTDVDALVQAYTAVITKYGLDTLDFDVEGEGLAITPHLRGAPRRSRGFRRTVRPVTR